MKRAALLVGTAALAVSAAVLVPRADGGRTAQGARLGTLSIPRIGLVTPWYEGTKTRTLAKGPGHYEETRMPGELGTVAIAGHRVTYRRPFFRLNEVRKGDRITIATRRGRFRYRVFAMKIVRPEDVWVLMQVRRSERLVLTACHPPRSAAKRLVVFARRVDRAKPTGSSTGRRSRR